jgi:predicted lipoprotein
MHKMKNIDFFASKILLSLNDIELERFYTLVQQETDIRHITHGQCTAETCTVMEKIRDDFHHAIQNIGTSY